MHGVGAHSGGCKYVAVGGVGDRRGAPARCAPSVAGMGQRWPGLVEGGCEAENVVEEPHTVTLLRSLQSLPQRAHRLTDPRLCCPRAWHALQRALSHACAFHGRGRRGRGEKRDMELRAMFVDRLCRDLLGRHREAAAVRVCRARGALAARAPSDVYDARARDMAAGSLTRVLFVTQGRGGGGGDVGRPPDRDTCVSGTTCSGSSEARLQYVEVGAGGVATSGGRWTSGR